MSSAPRAAPLVVITMAGLGSRFRAAGYTLPKYRVEAHGRTLFAWSLLSLREITAAGAEVVFVALAADQSGPFLAEQSARLGIRSQRLVELDALTDGQATSALRGMADSEADRPVVIYNIDTLVEPPAFHPRHLRGAGWIPCFAGAGDAWSFVRADPDGRVLEVREKQRISPHATLGLYAFGSVGLYRSAYAEFYANPANLERGERYVAPMYNLLVSGGAEVWMTEVDSALVHPLGTPGEVDAFAVTPPPATVGGAP